ncbi:putative FRE ferric reductase-like transmembrane component [Hortaea werneckii]|nr:putative FRE ferric reductase-like transmembrane component [Hortaea werneckii]
MLTGRVGVAALTSNWQVTVSGGFWPFHCPDNMDRFCHGFAVSNPFDQIEQLRDQCRNATTASEHHNMIEGVDTSPHTSIWPINKRPICVPGAMLKSALQDPFGETSERTEDNDHISVVFTVRRWKVVAAERGYREWVVFENGDARHPNIYKCDGCFLTDQPRHAPWICPVEIEEANGVGGAPDAYSFPTILWRLVHGSSQIIRKIGAAVVGGNERKGKPVAREPQSLAINVVALGILKERLESPDASFLPNWRNPAMQDIESLMSDTREHGDERRRSKANALPIERLRHKAIQNDKYQSRRDNRDDSDRREDYWSPTFAESPGRERSIECPAYDRHSHIQKSARGDCGVFLRCLSIPSGQRSFSWKELARRFVRAQSAQLIIRVRRSRLRSFLHSKLYHRINAVKTRSIMLKYIHPRAYFPDFRHGSTVVASISSGGELLLQHGIDTLFSKSGTASRNSCSVGREVGLLVTPKLWTLLLHPRLSHRLRLERQTDQIVLMVSK